MAARADRKLPTVKEAVDQFYQEIQEAIQELQDFWEDLGDEGDLLFFPEQPEEPFESPDDFLDTMDPWYGY